jgi:hypothetical protein
MKNSLCVKKKTDQNKQLHLVATCKQLVRVIYGIIFGTSGHKEPEVQTYIEIVFAIAYGRDSLCTFYNTISQD